MSSFYRKGVVGCALELRKPRLLAYWKKYLSFLNPCTLLMQLRKDELCCTDCTWESYMLFSLDVTIRKISFLNCTETKKVLRKEKYFFDIYKNEMKAALKHSLRYYFDVNSGTYEGSNHLEKVNFCFLFWKYWKIKVKSEVTKSSCFCCFWWKLFLKCLQNLCCSSYNHQISCQEIRNA